MVNGCRHRYVRVHCVFVCFLAAATTTHEVWCWRGVMWGEKDTEVKEENERKTVVVVVWPYVEQVG